MIRVTVWNEHGELGMRDEVKAVYPDGLHTAVAAFLNQNSDIKAGTAILADPQHGLSEETLKNTDVLIWWGHCYHDMVSDEIVERVVKHVNCGMGIIFLHSAHMSKPFRRLMGTSCTLKWREIGEHERLWSIAPAHPICEGIAEQFVIPHEEMYGECFDIPTPDESVFIGWFAGGEVFRSGVTYRRGLGKVFYFQPGHETFPVYHQAEVQRVLTNAVRWAKGEKRVAEQVCPDVKPLENI